MSERRAVFVKVAARNLSSFRGRLIVSFLLEDIELRQERNVQHEAAIIQFHELADVMPFSFLLALAGIDFLRANVIVLFHLFASL